MAYTVDENMSLKNILDGAAIELADDQISKVIENLLDPNTGESARKVKLELTFKPSKGSNGEQVEIEVKTSITLAPSRPLVTRALIGKDGKDFVANELKSGQQDKIDFKNVANIGGEK